MKRQRRTGVLVLATMLVAAVATFGAPGAPAGATWYNGICTGDDALDGVTMAIDFQELDKPSPLQAPDILRCSVNPNPGQDRTGLQALQDAGLGPAGATPWGLAFICRINGRPNSTETIPITGNPTYTEDCMGTPPAAAYWSYWHADGAGTTWTYSSYGAANRMVTPGGFEGWSFSLNRSASTNPPPDEIPENPAVDPTNATVAVSVDDLDRTISLTQTTSLSWTSTNASSVTAFSVSPATGGGSWTGSLTNPSGTQNITPTATGTYTYTIRAIGTGGPVYSTATLTVVP